MYLIQNISYISQYLFWNYIIYISYNPINRIMDKCILNYRRIEPKHKKIYVISNLIKGMGLGLNSHICINILYNYIRYGKWNIETMKTFGALYAALDMVSMFKVEKMQLNTKIHHTMVQVFYFTCLLHYNFSKTTLANPLVVYSIYSALSYIVNIYLSMRVFVKDEELLRRIKYISFIIYGYSCAQNWSYQLYFLLFNRNIPLIQKTLYGGLITTVIYDDWILINYLRE